MVYFRRGVSVIVLNFGSNRRSAQVQDLQIPYTARPISHSRSETDQIDFRVCAV